MAAGHDPKDDTRERLLDAAERLFCQKGFEATSVRDLTWIEGLDVDRLVDHVVQFDVAAIRGLAASAQSDRSTPGTVS